MGLELEKACSWSCPQEMRFYLLVEIIKVYVVLEFALVLLFKGLFSTFRVADSTKGFSL